ncbi:MAG TPA: hypothetical protein VEA78_08650 [Acidimicrobiales bacterium]|nr:hypothetical protein [Acidimicrobiales bacterium]
MFTDADRRALYEAALSTWGDHPADDLMGHLAPVGWGDVATKQDLAIVQSRLDARIDRLEAKVDGILPKVILANIGLVIATAGFVAAVLRTAPSP